MNKYQEALEKVICLLNELSNQGYEISNYHLNGNTEPLRNFIIDNIDIPEVVDTLQELVDKETPKKIKRFVKIDFEQDLATITTAHIDFGPIENGLNICPICGLELGGYRLLYCPRCGVKLDWGKEE